MSQPDDMEVLELQAALERTVDELEERRVAGIELRMLLDASEARLRTMGAELEEALLAARDADERRESARVEAIEMRVILDATEHRVGKLEADLAAALHGRDVLATDCARLTSELLEAQEERRTLEVSLQEVSSKLDEGERAIAELQDLRSSAAAEAASSAAERERYMEELRAAQGDVERLGSEVASAREATADALAQFATARREVEALTKRTRELAATPAARPDESGLRLAGKSDPAELAENDEDLEAFVSAAELPSSAAAAPIAGITVVHLDDRPEYREALESAVHQFPGLRYVIGDTEPAPVGGPCMVVANLFSTSGDPLAAVAAAERWGATETRALTYCADGTRGVLLGTVEYFPEPFDSDACATRLLEEGVQRLLMVSDNIELTNVIRVTMGKFRCSTSIALDARQAFELAALVRPEFVLVDLGLPRGEALRLIARLRADPKTAAMPTALLWDRPIEASDLRVHAARVARDTLLPPEDLKRCVLAALSDRSLRSEQMRETA